MCCTTLLGVFVFPALFSFPYATSKGLLIFSVSKRKRRHCRMLKLFRTIRQCPISPAKGNALLIGKKMKNRFYTPFCIAVCFLFIARCAACSCESSFVFLDGLNHHGMVAHVEILKHTPLPEEDIREGMRLAIERSYVKKGNIPPPPAPPFPFHSITWLKVLRWFHEPVFGDTILFLNGHGSECGADISNRKIGQECIVNISLGALGFSMVDDSIRSEKLADIISAISGFPMAMSSICQCWDLDVHGNKVIGPITKNTWVKTLQKIRARYETNAHRADKLWQKHVLICRKLEQTNPEKAARLRQRRGPQEFSYDRVARLIRRKMHQSQKSAS